MIVKNIDNNTQLVFTDNIIRDINSICVGLGYTKKDGELYKSVEITRDFNYYPPNSNGSVLSTKITYKKVNTIILNKKTELVVTDTNINKLVSTLNRYGSDYNVVIKGNSLKGGLSLDANNNIVSNDGTKISVNKSSNTGNEEKKMHNFIHNMSMDNGRMLYPVLKRFSNTVHLFKGNKSVLTGYVKLDDYLYIMKMPPAGIKSLTNASNCNYNINFNSHICEVEITDVVDGKIKYILNFSGNMTSVNNSEKFNPYILFTTSPISMQNQRMPFQTVNVNGLHVFITPLLFNNKETLAKLKGGINLLS